MELTSAELRAVEVIAIGERPDSPNYGEWRAECMMQWLNTAGLEVVWESEVVSRIDT